MIDVITGGKLTISGDTYTGNLKTSGTGELIISGGTINGTVTGNATISGGTFNEAVTVTGDISNGIFNKAVTVTGDISNGTFKDTVSVTGTISGGTFDKAVSGAVIYQGGTFKAAVSSTVTSTKPIPGTVPGATAGTTVPNLAQFAVAPTASMIEEHFTAQKNSSDMYVIVEDSHILVNKGTGDEKVYYNTTTDTFDEVLAANVPATITLTQDEEINEAHNFSTTSPVTIDLNGNDLTGTGSITSKGTVYIKGLGDGKYTLVLGAGDKATFSSTGAVTATAAKNIVDGEEMSYGDVKTVTKSTSSGIDINTIYFLKTVITLYRPPLEGAELPVGRFRPAKSFVLAMICLSVSNIVLGVFSQPIIEAIRSGLRMFA